MVHLRVPQRLKKSECILKMVYKWKEEHTPLFLEHFKNYPSLWDFKNYGYKNREVRAHATKSLIQDLNLIGVKEEDIKLKIKSIRTRYTCELSKINRSIKSGCAKDDIYVPKLVWFKQADEFLNAVCVPRETSSNFSISEMQLQVTIDENPVEEEQETFPGNDPLADLPRIPKSRKRLHDTSIDRETKQLKQNGSHQINNTVKGSMSDDNKGPSTENEFDLFCRSLAVQLKNMPLDRALICQQDLLSVMVQERLRTISTSSPTQHVDR